MRLNKLLAIKLVLLGIIIGGVFFFIVLRIFLPFASLDKKPPFRPVEKGKESNFVTKTSKSQEPDTQASLTNKTKKNESFKKEIHEIESRDYEKESTLLTWDKILSILSHEPEKFSGSVVGQACILLAESDLLTLKIKQRQLIDLIQRSSPEQFRAISQILIMTYKPFPLMPSFVQAILEKIHLLEPYEQSIILNGIWLLWGYETVLYGKSQVPLELKSAQEALNNEDITTFQTVQNYYASKLYELITTPDVDNKLKISLFSIIVSSPSLFQPHLIGAKEIVKNYFYNTHDIFEKQITLKILAIISKEEGNIDSLYQIVLDEKQDKQIRKEALKEIDNMGMGNYIPHGVRNALEEHK